MKKRIYMIISAILLLIITAFSVFAVGYDDLSSEISEDLSSEDNGSEETSEKDISIVGTAWKRTVTPELLEELEYAPDDHIFLVGLDLINDWTGLDELLEETPYLPGETYSKHYSRVSSIIFEQQLNAFIQSCYEFIDFELADYSEDYYIWVNTNKGGIIAFASLSRIEKVRLPNRYESPFEKSDRVPEQEPTDMTPAQIGDVNGDQRMDSLDAALMLKYDAEMIEYLPVSEPIDMPDTETVDRIRNDYWTNYLGNELGAPGKWETTIDDVRISKYYGNVNGYEIVFMEDNYPEQPAYQTVWVGNHGFRYGVIKEAFAYKDGQFYTFKEAYDAGYLTNDDIYTLGTRMPLEWKGATYDGVIMGDCNFDSKLDSLDAAWILKYDAKLVEYSCYTENYGDMDMSP